MTNPIPTYTDLSWARAQANAYRIDAQDYFKLAMLYAKYPSKNADARANEFTFARHYFERAMVNCARLASTNAQIRELEYKADQEALIQTVENLASKLQKPQS